MRMMRTMVRRVFVHECGRFPGGPQSALAVITIAVLIPADQYGVSPTMRFRSMDMHSLLHKPHVVDSIFAGERLR